MTIEDVIAEIKKYNPEEEEIVRKAYAVAEKAHSHQKRESGEPYIIHPLSVAINLINEMDVYDVDTICAALLHDTIEDSDSTFEEIERYLENCNRYTESNTLMLLRFARSTGLRVDEIAHQKIEEIHLEGGEFGLGYIDVSCGKHGRKRVVDIKSVQDRQVVEEVIENER